MPMRFFPGSDEPGGPTGAAATDPDPPPPDQDAEVSKTEVKKPGKQLPGRKEETQMSMPPEASTTSAPETIGNFHHVHPAAPAAPDERIKNDDAAPLDLKEAADELRATMAAFVDPATGRPKCPFARPVSAVEIIAAGAWLGALVDRSVMPDGLLYRFWQGRSIRPLEGRPATTAA